SVSNGVYEAGKHIGLEARYDQQSGLGVKTRRNLRGKQSSNSDVSSPVSSH
ncbi:unnamed protein product, partial [Linum tenue]